ncbi:M61 family metallopeptidase [Polaromonas sp. A23]|uniref:M61 family metallopeptidase n=1 Tax=Polaromonas sp. A23 TaxID=1944133 RepID=UPI0009862FD5|nr:M61 family metallopeptidase [Polaromonas sp. A23]OOG37343.1 peptidase M61 [Polaromonas sp. A23]
MPKPPVKTRTPAAAIHYRVEVANLHAHLFRVTLTVAKPLSLQRVALPVWIPGSYLVREFSKNLQGLKARQGTRALPAGQVSQLDKCSWQIRCNADRPLVLTYEVYANDNSVRTASLDATRGFFNGSSLCLQVEGQERAPHLLELVTPAGVSGWAAATGLSPLKVNKQGFGTYLAADYDELVDCPVEMGAFWSGSFVACGVPHRFVVAGATSGFDGERLLADTRKICEAQIRFWHGSKKPPHKNYLFMLNAVDDGYGGLEHRNSTALICKRQDLPRVGSSKLPEGYTTLRGLISHEYFHTWNVKRLRPAEFSRYAYDSENYTELLWFFEGFTSYYDDLILRRAGLLDDASYLKLLNKTINQVMQTPGRLVQSVAQASFDAWVKYYRQDENTPNATVSYYTKGALVALCLDLSLRAESKAAVPVTLDDVMRRLWVRCRGGMMTEADFAEVLQELSGRSYAPEIASWVHGTSELPLRDLLQRHGVGVLDEPSQLAQTLGLRVQDGAGGVQIKTVLRNGAAENAGFAAGDEWLAVEPVIPGKSKTPVDAWRLAKLEDVTLYAGPHKKVVAIVARDKRLLRLELSLPPTENTWRLVSRDSTLVSRWLAPAA